MSVVASPMTDLCFVLYDDSWDAYESLLDSLGDRYLRHTDVEGTLRLLTLDSSSQGKDC